MAPDFEILSLGLCIEPITMRWGGKIVAHFALSCPPFVVSKAHLLQRPDGTFTTSIAPSKGGGRFAIVDPAFREAVIEAAAGLYGRAAVRLLHAVPPVAKASTTAGTEDDQS